MAQALQYDQTAFIAWILTSRTKEMNLFLTLLDQSAQMQ
jgi:hypothetical protein